MTPEAQRIAIAEACGWTMALNPDWAGEEKSPCGKKQDREWAKIPDYLNDLNAMHEAEKVLPNKGEFKRLYFDCLGRLANLGGTTRECATASQRAEAFLRTISKWKE